VPPRDPGPIPSSLGATRFLAFGDSITWGSLSAYDASFLYDAGPWAYPPRLKQALDFFHPGPAGQTPRTYTVVNAGEPGEWASVGEGRIQSEITAHRPHGLLLLEGINDLANEQSISQTITALGHIINTARANNVTVLIATMFQTYETCVPPENVECRDNARQLVVPFNDAIRQLATGRQNVYIVDLYAALGTNHAYVGADGLHPNEAGYERIATTFLARIEAVFGIRSSFQ